MSTGLQASQHIRAEIMKLGDQLRERHPWLPLYQDAIGAFVMMFSIGVMIASGYGYIQGEIGAVTAVVIIAVVTSFIHELEHDLIHYLYFRKNPIIHNLMMLLCWLTRPGTVNPWIRRRIHLLHHKVSGTAEDIEERGITNGVPWSPLRLLMIADAPTSILSRTREAHKNKRLGLMLLKAFVAYFPVGIAYYCVWYTYLLFHTSVWFSPEWAFRFWSASIIEAMPVIDILAVTLIWPFFIRSFCLNFVSSNMHYYGDVELNNIVQQTQVWTRWWLFPLHLFCFNFASTHAIHHFVVRDPFYIRQWIAKDAHKIMQDNGVRFNDFQSFKRANRFTKLKPS